MAQFGRAPALGAGGCWFKSSHPDHFNEDRGVTVSITDCDSVREGSSPFDPPKFLFDKNIVLN